VYQVFSEDELSRTDDQHISVSYHSRALRILHERVSQFACGRIPEFVKYASNNNWLVIGEWSLAKTDCTKWLNGRGTGARWDGTFGEVCSTPSRYRMNTESFYQGHYFGSCGPMTGNSDGFSNDYKTFLRRYWEAQVTAAEAVQGWIYWTWKVRWSLGILPRPSAHLDARLRTRTTGATVAG
jgi:glucan 1,3-beta-glucosidase